MTALEKLIVRVVERHAFSSGDLSIQLERSGEMITARLVYKGYQIAESSVFIGKQ